MSEKINFTIDGKECTGDKGQYIVDAAASRESIFPRSAI